MDDATRELLTQAEIDALLAAVDSSGEQPNELDQSEAEAIAALATTIFQIIAPLLQAEFTAADPEFSVFTAAEARSYAASGGLAIEISGRDAARWLAMAAAPDAGSNLEPGSLAAPAAALGSAVTAWLGGGPDTAVTAELMWCEPEMVAAYWPLPDDAPYVGVWWPAATGDAATRTGLLVPLADVRGMLDAAAAAQPAVPTESTAKVSQAAAAIPLAEYQELAGHDSGSAAAGIEMLLDVPLEITTVLGRARRQVGEVLALGPGSIIELDKLAGEPIEVLVNGKLIARGEVVVIDEHFGIRITDIVSRVERLRQLG